LRFAQVCPRYQLRNELFHSKNVSDEVRQPSTAFLQRVYGRAFGVDREKAHESVCGGGQSARSLPREFVFPSWCATKPCLRSHSTQALQLRDSAFLRRDGTATPPSPPSALGTWSLAARPRRRTPAARRQVLEFSVFAECSYCCGNCTEQRFYSAADFGRGIICAITSGPRERSFEPVC
jgi:hypothetical protein